MVYLLIYAFLLILFALLSIVVILNFYHLRIKGDRTVLFIILFGILCGCSILFTLSLLPFIPTI